MTLSPWLKWNSKADGGCRCKYIHVCNIHIYKWIFVRRRHLIFNPRFLPSIEVLLYFSTRDFFKFVPLLTNSSSNLHLFWGLKMMHWYSITTRHAPTSINSFSTPFYFASQVYWIYSASSILFSILPRSKS